MNKIIFLAPALYLTSASLLAGNMGSVNDVTHNWVLTLSGGPSWTTNSGKSQIIQLEPDLIKAYIADKNDSTLGNVELFLGMQRSVNEKFMGQLGIALGAASNQSLKGSIWDDADPEFDNFYYNYKVKHAQALLKGKLIVDVPYWAQPYISGGVGVGFNRAHMFTTTPKIFEQLPAPNFEANTKTTFTYTLGIGLQKTFKERWNFGVGYEFADWGKSNLGASYAQTIGTGLALNHLYTNQLQFSLSYII